MGSANLSWAALAALAILTYLRLDSLPMPLPSTLPIGPLDPSKTPRPVSVEGFAPMSLLAGGGQTTASTPRASPVVRLFEGRVVGSESVSVAPDGSGDLVMCDRYGYVWRAKRTAGSTPAEQYELEDAPVAHLGPGRPLGFHFDAAGNLVACVSGSGLVLVEAGAFSRDEGERERARVVLLTAAVSPAGDGGRDRGGGGADGRTAGAAAREHSPILYANDLDISSRTGIVYFTDSVAIPPARNAAGFWDTMQAYLLSLAQGQPTGRLLSYDPSTRRTDVVADGLWFANGVALSPDEKWAAVVETNSLRVYKVHLVGSERGKKEVLVDGLPGYPDGITRAFAVGGGGDERVQDGFWLALVAPLQPLPAKLIPWKLGRLLMAWTPEWLRPPLSPWGAAARLRIRRDSGVDVVGWIVDPKGTSVSSTSAVTDASEFKGGEGRLFFGNLAGDYVSLVDGASESVEAAAEKSVGDGGGGGDRSEL